MKKYIAALLLLSLLCASLTGCQNRTRRSRYSLEEQGLIPILEQAEELTPLEDHLTLAYFSCTLDKYGNMQTYDLNLNAYDDSRSYLCRYSIAYGIPETEPDGETVFGFEEEAEKKYRFTVQCFSLEELDTGSPSWNANEDIYYLDQEVRRIPLEKQAALLKYDQYVLESRGRQKPEAGQPVMDGSSGREFPVLSLAEYQRGEGGTSDGSTAIVFELRDAMNTSYTDRMLYLFETADEETIYGNPDFVPQTDYYINNNVISFSKDFGETWIPADIPEDAMQKTLSFYRIGDQLPEFSYHLSTDHDIIAFFYGEYPSLRISRDNGKTWQDTAVGTEFTGFKPPVRRIIHFLNDLEGYAGLGTEWTMGSGEMKYFYTTEDGGMTWQSYELPLMETSSLLTGLGFSDLTQGIVSLKSATDLGGYPTLFYTEDGGTSWTELDFPWEQLPENIDTLTKVTALNFEDGVYTLILGEGALRMSFESSSLSEGWSFREQWEDIVHTYG